MAKVVNPPAVLEPRADDVDLPLHLLAKLPPFSKLKAAPSLDKYPGACKLRFFQGGEDVCVHGEPGWSAFCFVPAADIAALRDLAVKALAEGPANREKTAAAVAKLEAERQAMTAQMASPDVAEKDKKEVEKKLGSNERELEKQHAALALIEEEVAKLPEVRSRLDAWLQEQQKVSTDKVERLTQAAAQLPKQVAAAGAQADPGQQALLDELQGAVTPARQRQIADLLEPTQPTLAGLLHTLASADGVQRIALARLPRLRLEAPPSRSWFERMRSWLSPDRPRRLATPTVIPSEGPRDLDYYSRLSSLFDGELIGEISCWNRTPRSATVTMARSGFAVELMRHILDMMVKDAAYQARAETAQRQRLLNSALREIPVFSGLPEEELAYIARGMEFLSFEAGSLICDEHEDADSLYVVGNGIVKVVTGVSWLLPPSAPLDGAALRKELTAAGGKYAEARALLSSQLGPDADAAMAPALNRLLVQPAWRDAPALRAVIDGEKLVFRVWRMLAAPGHGRPRDLVRCNRLLLQAVDGQAYPALKPGANSETEEAFRLAEFAADWKKLATRLVADDKKSDDPARVLWDRLPPSVQEALRKGKTAEMAAADKEGLVAALNQLIGSELLLLTPAGSVALTNANLAAQLLPMLADGQLWSDFDYQRWNRCLNRLVLETLCPKSLAGLPRPSGLPTILAYCSRNQVLGEIGLLGQQPRTATLATYNHPKNDPKREVGQVQLYRVGKELFEEVLGRHPELRARLQTLAAERQAPRRHRAQGPTGNVDRGLIHSPRGEQLGLVEGQRLMLIDLDRCTRCDECVRACVATHDDGRSRLFLVGNRHAQFLVPATCRSCLDPVCMIGCPVNSIQHGDNKEIVIRDWCIGCSKCADQCPYGSIQMHDIGVVPAAAHGWRFAPAPAGEDWTQPEFKEASWPVDATPFVDNTQLEESLARLPGFTPRGAVSFRRTFHLAGADYHKDGSFQLELTAPGDQARVWLNGQELKTEEKPRQGKRKYAVGPAHKFIEPGENLLAVQVVRPAQATGQTLFSLRLDAERDAGSPTIEIKLVTNRAVVCDLCSNLPTGPACVTACPHEAAMRINAAAP